MNNNESKYNFTNERDAVRFAKAQGGPIEVDVARIARGHWVVTITTKPALVFK